VLWQQRGSGSATESRLISPDPARCWNHHEPCHAGHRAIFCTEAKQCKVNTVTAAAAAAEGTVTTY